MRPVSVIWRKYWLLPVLLIAGYVGNYFSLSLFFGVDFIFGSIATLMVVVYYGSAWGVLSALIAGSYTLILWKHPYALIVLVAEAAFLGWRLRRRRDNLVLLDTVFWVVLGMPLVYLFYRFNIGMTEIPTRLVMVKQASNGIFNSLIASFLINSFELTPAFLPSSLVKPHAHKLSFEQTLFNLLMAFLFFPLLLVTVINGQQAFQSMEQGMNDQLTAIAYPVQNAIQQWFDNQLLGVKVVAQQAAPLLTQVNQSNSIVRQELAILTQSFQTAFTGYKTLLIGDRQGIILATAPEFNQAGESLLGRLYPQKLEQIAQNQSQPLISDFHRDQTDINPHIGITFPLVYQAQLQGFAYASLSLEQAANLIQPNKHQASQEIILIDRQNRVLASCVPGLTPTTPFDPTQGGSIREIGNQTYHWFPEESISPMLRWRKSYYYRTLPIKNSPDWQLIVRLSATDQIDYLQLLSVKKLAILLFLTIGGLITSIAISRRVASPLLNLSKFTTDIPQKLSQRQIKPLILNSQVSEVAVLNDNFNEMLGTLQNQFQTIEAARDSLENRVRERTQELLIINQKLADEIQARERIEQVLRKSEERYDLAVSGTNDGLWDWDIVQAKIYYSPVWEKILGYHPESVPFIDPQWLTQVHPDDRQRFEQAITNQFKSDVDVFSEIFRLKHENGHYLWIDMKGNCLRDDQHRTYRIVGTITDITEKKQAEVELRHAKENAELANRTKSEFLANISHEIRTPMNAILGFCELLQSSIESPRSRSYLEAINASSKTLMALIDDILDISKIEAGKLVLHRDLFDLNEILAETKQIFSQKAQSKGVKLVTQLTVPVAPIIYFDEIRLRQILFNIVGNALKFTEEGQVSIQIIGDLQSPGSIALTIRVADTGIGISPEDQTRIFDVFTQSEGQSTRKYGGTGLGLTITKRLTQLLGGSLSLASQVGQGSVFSLHFPGVQLGEGSSLIRPNPQQNDLAQFSPLRVLVVDDVESNRQLLKGFFEVTGHQVWAVDSGLAAIAVSQQQVFDLVLMDLMMPEMDGQAAIAQIRQTAQNPTMPIVMVTASSQSLSHLLTPQGCQAVLLKPVTQNDLVGVLRNLFPLVETSNTPASPSPTVAALTCPLLSPEQRQTLIDQLEQQEALVWGRLRCTLISRELRSFGDRLKTWGNDYGWPTLSHYAESLLLALDTYDSHQIQTLMAEFPQFRATLIAATLPNESNLRAD
jgi:PAS domain S-box-containing protein